MILASSLAKIGFSGSSSTSSLNCARATPVFFSRRAASASKGKWLQVVSVIGRRSRAAGCRHSCRDSIEAKKELFVSRQTSDDVRLNLCLSWLGRPACPSLGPWQTGRSYHRGLSSIASSRACLIVAKNAVCSFESGLRGTLPRKRLSSRKNSELRTPWR